MQAIGHLSIDLFRGPQFFKESNEEKTERQQIEKKIRGDLLNVKHNMDLATEPDELIQDMSSYLKDVGYSTSFLDDQSREKMSVA